MDVRVGNLHAQHRHADALAGEGRFLCLGNPLGKEVQASQLVVLKVEDIVDLALGDYKRMTLDHRVDVKESEESVVFGHFVAGNLTSYYSAEYTCHSLMRY